MHTQILRATVVLRQSNLLFSIATLQHLAQILFTLDQMHYSRWMSVFIQDFLLLPEKNRQLFIEFFRGSFAVNKSQGLFIVQRYGFWLSPQTEQLDSQSKKRVHIPVKQRGSDVLEEIGNGTAWNLGVSRVGRRPSNSTESQRAKSELYIEVCKRSQGCHIRVQEKSFHWRCL